MNQNNIKDLPKLKTENYENIFSVLTDEDGFYYYNLLQTIQMPIDLPDGFFSPYTCSYGDTWPFISYKNYLTPNLWWIILPFNNIINSTVQPEPGQIIKILKTPFVKNILSELSTRR